MASTDAAPELPARTTPAPTSIGGTAAGDAARRRPRLRRPLYRLGPPPPQPSRRRQHGGRDPRLLRRAERRQDRARRRLPGPVRRNRLPVVHRRHPELDRRPGGSVLRHCVPRQRPALRGDVVHLRRGGRRPDGRGQVPTRARSQPVRLEILPRWLVLAGYGAALVLILNVSYIELLIL